MADITINAQDHAAEERLAEWQAALTDKEAADALGISVRSIHSYVAAGRLKPIRLPGFVRFTRRAIADCIETGASAKVA